MKGKWLKALTLKQTSLLFLMLGTLHASILANLYMGGGGFEEIEGDDEAGALFLCPFCAEDLDIVGLCCHIDEDHPLEAKNGLGPLVRQMMPLVEACPVYSMARSASGNPSIIIQ